MQLMSKEQNAALCQWLGIDPVVSDWYVCLEGTMWYPSYRSQELALQELEGIKRRHPLVSGKWMVSQVYPVLSTRENFWLVWDALKAKGYQVALETMSSQANPLCCEISEATRESYKHWVTKLGNDAEVVLPDAALELMEIKKGGGE